ncbi:MAG: bifunctional nuclease family protein [Microthrixaceae bacterium]
MIEVEVDHVTVDPTTNTPMVLLRETKGRGRAMSIFIGHPEATAIVFALEHIEAPRPLTHDLLKDVLATVGVEVEYVLVSELRGSTFYAELHLRGGGDSWSVSCRPSDALALAVRVQCTIFVVEDVMDAALVEEEGDSPPRGGEDAEATMEDFRQFINTVNPEDFAS